MHYIYCPYSITLIIKARIVSYLSCLCKFLYTQWTPLSTWRNFSRPAYLHTTSHGCCFCGSLRWQMLCFLYTLLLLGFGPHSYAWQVLPAWAYQMEREMHPVGFSYLSHGTPIDVVLLLFFFFPAIDDCRKKENGKKKGKSFMLLLIQRVWV